MNNPLLSIKDLTIGFDTDDGPITAVDGISFDIAEGEILGLVGESGCGKSVTAMSILRLLPQPPAVIRKGTIEFQNRNLLDISINDMRKIRGNDISIVFQEPMTSLSPLHRIGDQLIEGIRLHKDLSKADAHDLALSWLKKAGIADYESKMMAYPHELSGGLRQRVMIAMALMTEPKLLIADEPTTALDVTIQAQILDIILQMQTDLNMSVLLITHDLAVVAETCSRVIVMYAGKIVEIADVEEIFKNPKHPYTQGLLKSVPSHTQRQDELFSIPGQVPSPFEYPKGCRFCDRCDIDVKKCITEEPRLEQISEGHWVSCWERSTRNG